MKLIKRLIRRISSPGQKKAFYVTVKCSDCGEEVRVRIDSSSDLQMEYNARNPKHAYTVKKDIIGRDCFSLMKVTIALTGAIKVLFVDTEGCEFIGFKKE